MNTRIMVLTFLFVGAGFVFCVPVDTEASSRGYRAEERIERRIATITQRFEARKARVEVQKNRILQRLANIEERLHTVTSQYTCWLANHTSCTSDTSEDDTDTSTDDDTTNEETEDDEDASDANTDTNTGDESDNSEDDDTTGEGDADETNDDTTEESDTENTDDEESNDSTDEENETDVENEDETTEGGDNDTEDEPDDTNTNEDTTEEGDTGDTDDEEESNEQENDTPDIAVRVNEVAWMGTAEGGTKEWIELYNDGSALDLAGWTLVADDGAPSITLAGTIVAGGYFLLERTSDEAVQGVVADQIYTGDLGNKGEVLRLLDPSGAVVDTVNGADDWAIGGDNVTKETLQRMNDGWFTATGTPRALNVRNVVDDTSEADDDTESDSDETGNETDTDNGTDTDPNEDIDEEPADDVDEPEDETSPDTTVRISEIAWMGSAEGSTKEWIEIYNPGQELDLAGWTLTADDGAPSITLAGTISAHGYFLLERTSDAAVPSVLADQIYTGDLSNGGEVLRLRDSAGALVDTVDGSGGWAIGGNNTTKETLQRVGDGWVTVTGTPRALNASV